MKLKKKSVIIIVVIAVCLAVLYRALFLSGPALNVTSPMGGRLPIISLQWDGDTLQPTYNSGNVRLDTAEVNLDFPELSAQVIVLAEEFLHEQLSTVSLKKLLPQGHMLYGLLEFYGNYWLITGKQPSSLYLVALGSFHQPEEPIHTPIRYQTFYRSKLKVMQGGGASMSSAY